MNKHTVPAKIEIWDAVPYFFFAAKTIFYGKALKYSFAAKTVFKY